MASVEKCDKETEEVMVTAAGITGDEAAVTEGVKVDKLLFTECRSTMMIKVQTFFYKSKQGMVKNLLRKEPKPQTVNQMQPNSFEEKHLRQMAKKQQKNSRQPSPPQQTHQHKRRATESRCDHACTCTATGEC